MYFPVFGKVLEFSVFSIFSFQYSHYSTSNISSTYHFHSWISYTTTPTKINWRELQHLCQVRNFPPQVSPAVMLPSFQVHAQALTSQLSRTNVCWLTLLFNCRRKHLYPQTGMRSGASSTDCLVFKSQLCRLKATRSWLAQQDLLIHLQTWATCFRRILLLWLFQVVSDVPAAPVFS